MHADDLILNDSSHGQIVERVCKHLPDVRAAVRTHAFVEEAVDLCDLSAFVVAAQERDALLVADFVKKHESHGLDGVVATVDVITQEYVVGLWQQSADAEKLLEIQELAVDIPTDRNGTPYGLTIRLLLQDLSRLLSQSFDLWHRQFFPLPYFVDLTFQLEIRRHII